MLKTKLKIDIFSMIQTWNFLVFLVRCIASGYWMFSGPETRKYAVPRSSPVFSKQVFAASVRVSLLKIRVMCDFLYQN